MKLHKLILPVSSLLYHLVSSEDLEAGVEYGDDMHQDTIDLVNNEYYDVPVEEDDDLDSESLRQVVIDTINSLEDQEELQIDSDGFAPIPSDLEFTWRTVYMPPECAYKSQPGDKLTVHHYSALEETGTEFLTSFRSDEPYSFVLGTGEVIKGWDDALVDMCPGEKRHIVIPSDLAWGARGLENTVGPHEDVISDVELLSVESDSH